MENPNPYLQQNEPSEKKEKAQSKLLIFICSFICLILIGSILFFTFYTNKTKHENVSILDTKKALRDISGETMVTEEDQDTESDIEISPELETTSESSSDNKYQNTIYNYSLIVPESLALSTINSETSFIYLHNKEAWDIVQSEKDPPLEKKKFYHYPPSISVTVNTTDGSYNSAYDWISDPKNLPYSNYNTKEYKLIKKDNLTGVEYRINLLSMDYGLSRVFLKNNRIYTITYSYAEASEYNVDTLFEEVYDSFEIH